jgi:hypothetical protein
MADVLLEQLILQPALIKHDILVGLPNKQDASTININSLMFHLDTNMTNHRMPYASRASARPSASTEVVLFSGKSSTIRYDDVERYDVDARMCLVHISLDGIQGDNDVNARTCT